MSDARQASTGQGFGGLGVVVTGAAGGIGRALAARMVAEGARVVVNDLDADALAGAAAEIGASPIAGDAASVEGVEALVATARERLGEIDIWFGNAGVEQGRGLQTSEASWTLAHEVNVMSHVRASRLLIPGWLERGTGTYVVTASAAGLVTVIDNPAYAVSKHGAVAFAEWLALTYRHRGVRVHAICPQGVRTRMYEESGALRDLLVTNSLLEPAEVAEATVRAMVEERFLVLPHPEVAEYYAVRATQTERWIAGMNRFQQSYEAAIQ